MDDIADLLQFKLREKTSPLWASKVMESFDVFLQDHAAAEKKAMATCMSMVAKYPDKPELVETCLLIAREELEHFHDVARLLYERGLRLKGDEKDVYIQGLIKLLRPEVRDRFLDRLLIAAIIENRACERFVLVANAMDDSHELKKYYERLSREEAKHYGQYVKLARQYFTEVEIRSRLSELLDAEAAIVRNLPLTPLLH